MVRIYYSHTVVLTFFFRLVGEFFNKKNKTDNKIILVCAVRLHLLHEYMNTIHLYQHHYQCIYTLIHADSISQEKL